MWGWRRREQLESFPRQIGESRRIGDRGRAGTSRLRCASAIEICDRRSLGKVRDADLFGEGFDAVQLLERLRRRGSVVVPHFLDADNRDTLSAEGAQLAGGDGLRHEVR